MLIKYHNNINIVIISFHEILDDVIVISSLYRGFYDNTELPSSPSHNVEQMDLIINNINIFMILVYASNMSLLFGFLEDEHI